MLGITLEGKKEILGIWIGENETSKYWLTLLNDSTFGGFFLKKSQV
jgi:transposase-like protein